MRQRSDTIGVHSKRREQRSAVPGSCTYSLSDIVDAVSELNSQVLEALSHSAQSEFAFPLETKLRGTFAGLSSGQRQRARHCGVLLADVGFGNLKRWQSLALRGEYDRTVTESDWLPAREAVLLASAVLLIAWHIVHIQPSLAGVLLGMPEPVVLCYRKLGVADLTQLARRHPQWVRPRWPNRPDVWRSILAGADRPSTHDSAAIILRCLKACTSESPRLLSSLDHTI